MPDQPAVPTDLPDGTHPAEHDAMASWRFLTRFVPPTAVAFVISGMVLWTCTQRWTHFPAPTYDALVRGYLPLSWTNPTDFARYVVGLLLPIQLVYFLVEAISVRAAFAPRGPGQRVDMLLVPGFAPAAALTIRALSRNARLAYFAAYATAAFIAVMPVVGVLRVIYLDGSDVIDEYLTYGDLLVVLLPFPILASWIALLPELPALWTRAWILRETGALRRAARATAFYFVLLACCGVRPTAISGVQTSQVDDRYGVLALNLVTAALLWRAARGRRVIDPEVQLWAERLADPSR